MNSARPDISKYAGTIPYAYRVKVKVGLFNQTGDHRNSPIWEEGFKLTVKNASKVDQYPISKIDDLVCHIVR